MASALASLYTGRKVRSDTAMTGEITLSGLVFPVGGIKEKVLAAHRAGIRRIILPLRNEADTEDIPEDVRNELEIIPAKYISDVLAAALETSRAFRKSKTMSFPKSKRIAATETSR
jgi:ATP-dependent Lon protease